MSHQISNYDKSKWNIKKKSYQGIIHKITDLVGENM